ncbi:alkaline phosphatase family protein [Nocardioides rotundus]|uniref:alkaline phosphatase D family protein n=1 Tax=Nocardioides rotundus TaxID=1774216 RepID=UPI001CBF92E6|nr:alkaline phosphatase D family protein [Nocardioides rotundus]UAL28658.1 alkaline phosphatase family protein [Nocardioides rotundus]
MTDLELGPLLRYVDASSAAIWVKVSGDARVAVRATDRDTGKTYDATARTFAVHGHHYALVELDGLPAGSKLDYQVLVDERQVWPSADTGDARDYPPSLIPTLQPGKPLRMAFGSCRTSVSHDEQGHRTHGVDALRSYALRMAGLTDAGLPDDPDPSREVRWPDLVLFLGDQVYADETTAEMRAFIEARRDIEQPPGEELKDYQEYAHLYQLAWSDPANRWLLSTLPSAMIFDDHDIRDDWNTSRKWKDEMEATDWWHDRIVAGLASYWVYQHLGNLSPAERAEDKIWKRIVEHAGDAEEYDATELLDTFAERADQEPEYYRWSFARDFDDQARLVVVDSRAARVLEEDSRSLLDETELRWLDEQLQGDVDNLLIGTSLPFLLAPGLHYVEAFNEAWAGGELGSRAAWLGEKVRQTVDLEHWAAFQDAFQQVCDMVLEVARGQRGRPPRTVTFLSGDVHHSYVSEARPTPKNLEEHGPIRSRILQAVCSPIRNPLPVKMRFLTAFLSYGVAGPIGHVLATTAHVPQAPLTWKLIEGPWFDNNLATLEVTDDGLSMWWATGVVEQGDHALPRLVGVEHVEVDA